MIEQIVNTNKKKFNLVTELYASSPTKVRLVAFDPYKKGAIYMDRWKTIDGNEKLELRLPQSPKRLMVRIMPESSDLEVVGFKAKKLLQFPACYSRQKKILNQDTKQTQNANEPIYCVLKPNTKSIPSRSNLKLHSVPLF